MRAPLPSAPALSRAWFSPRKPQDSRVPRHEGTSEQVRHKWCDTVLCRDEERPCEHAGGHGQLAGSRATPRAAAVARQAPPTPAPPPVAAAPCGQPEGEPDSAKVSG